MGWGWGVPNKNLRKPADSSKTAKKPSRQQKKLRFQRKLSSFIDFLDFLTAKLAKKRTL